MHDCDQSTKTADDDIKIVVTMLGMEDASERAPHHRQSLDATAARSESEELRQGQRQQRQRQGRSRAKARPRMQRTNRPRKQRTTIIHCKQSGHVKAECRERDRKTLPLQRGDRWQRHHIQTTQRWSCRCSADSQARHTSSFTGAQGCGKELMLCFERWSQVSGQIQ